MVKWREQKDTEDFGNFYIEWKMIKALVSLQNHWSSKTDQRSGSMSSREVFYSVSFLVSLPVAAKTVTTDNTLVLAGDCCIADKITVAESYSKSISGKYRLGLFTRIQRDDMKAALLIDGKGQAATWRQTRGDEGAMKYMTALSQNSSTEQNSLVLVIIHAATI